MIQLHTFLNVADNSRARELMCIQIIGTGNQRYADINNIIVAILKKANVRICIE
ncbi:50S ribosomal protein L14, chloroplastic [Apostasia shenzhenica]|uniref:50S ribosomal protein L14, chloroplastic n=1 Tax=Apostasia shenzhenica TaxID=1088818 RepID=A0A2I0A522_9ASPA|nr:50S ribosomal protein L14, chloroplastic [Apostasia shenzhenica]